MKISVLVVILFAWPGDRRVRSFLRIVSVLHRIPTCLGYRFRLFHTRLRQNTNITPPPRFKIVEIQCARSSRPADTQHTQPHGIHPQAAVIHEAYRIFGHSIDPQADIAIIFHRLPFPYQYRPARIDILPCAVSPQSGGCDREIVYEINIKLLENV
jgi:hypothetical protein